MKATEREVLIFCTSCKRKGPARNGPKRRGRRWVWVNTCTSCGTEYAAPSKQPPELRALERAGQRRLFE
jgi:hypothetical protein